MPSVQWNKNNYHNNHSNQVNNININMNSNNVAVEENVETNTNDITGVLLRGGRHCSSNRIHLVVLMGSKQHIPKIIGLETYGDCLLHTTQKK